jgi:hypothetical protein
MRYLLSTILSLASLLAMAQSAPTPQKIQVNTPELRIPAAHACERFAFTSDDKTLITLGNNEVKIWDMEGPYLLKTLRWPGMDTLFDQRIMFSGDQQMACIHAKGNLRFINLRTVEWENTWLKIPEAANLCMTPDGKWIYLLQFDGNKDKNILQKLDVATGKSTKLFDFKAKSRENPDGVGITQGMQLSADGTQLLLSGYDSGGMLFDLTTGKTLKVFSKQLPMFFAPNGDLIVSTNLSADPNMANVPNPQYLIEALENNTWKTLRKIKFTLQNSDIPDGNGIVWISHDHQNKILFENFKHFYVFDAKTWTVSPRREYTPGQTFGSTHFVKISDGGKYLFTNSSLEGFSVETGNLVKKVGFFPYLPFNLTQANIGDDKGIFAGYKHLHFDEKGFRIDLLPVLEGCETYDYLQRSIYRPLANQKKVLMISGGGVKNYQLKSADLGDATSDVSDINIEAGIDRSTVEIRPYDDNNTVVLSCDDRLVVMDAKTWKQKQQIVFGDGYYNTHFYRRDESYILERSADRTNIIVHLKAEEGDETHRIACFDLVQKRMIWAYDEPNPLSNPVYTDGSKQVWCVSETGVLVKLDAKTGKVIQKSAKIPYANAGTQISASGKYLFNFINNDESVFGTTQINVVDAATLKVKFSLTQQRLPYIGSVLIDKERLLITQDEDLKVWDMASGKLLAHIVLIENSADWIVSTPDGRFDGSPGGLKQMHYVQGRESIPLEQLYEGFYTPNLLSEVMDTSASKLPPAIEINQLKCRPRCASG